MGGSGGSDVTGSAMQTVQSETTRRRGARGAVAGAFLAATVLSGMASTPAQALELFGKCLFGECRSRDGDGLIDPKPYSATIDISTDEGPDRALGKAVQGASLLWQNRSVPAAGSAGLLTRAKADYKRILAALYENARYAGDISITWNGQEVANIPAGTELPDNAEFSITVRAGPVFRFGRTEIVNAAPPASQRRDRVSLPTDEGFVRGAPAYASAVKKAGRLAVEAWRQQGYAKAGIASQSVTANHDTHELNVTLTLQPGRSAVYGPVTVEGTDRMQANFVARQVGLAEGAEYDPDDLKRAEKRLQRLGVFQAVSLKEADDIGPDGKLPLMLTVQETKLHRIGVGATLSTVDGAGVESYWLHRNLFGRAERLRLDGKISGIGSTLDFAKLDYFLGAELTMPGRFTPDTDIVIGGAFEQEVLDLYTKRLGSASVYANHFYSDSITLTAGTYVSYGSYDDVFGTRNFGIFGVEGKAQYDTRNNKLNPKSGFYTQVGVKPFYEWVYGNVVGKVEAEGRAFRAIDADERTVLAARLKIGAMFGAPINQVPQDELFLAGGGQSVRGYPYRSIGVAVPGGTSGGRSLIEASAEIRRDVTDSIGVVGFADIGQVGSGSMPDFSGDLKIGVGAGIRYNTGLGPLRLDVAVPINRQAGDPTFAIYAGIGQAF